MDAKTLPATHRHCNQCGTAYDVLRRGRGGSIATDRDRELFPHNENTATGVRPERTHWMHGAFCSDGCYDAAYHEPPYPYGP